MKTLPSSGDICLTLGAGYLDLDGAGGGGGGLIMAFKRTAGGGRGGECAAAAGGLQVVSITRPITELASVTIIPAIRSTGVRPVNGDC